MPNTVRRQVSFCFATAVSLVALVLPAGAAAAPGDSLGGLIQGAHQSAPHPCISQQLATGCGTVANGGVVNGGLGQAHGVAISADGKSVYVAAESGALSTFARNTATGVLTYQGCIKDQTSTEACAANSLRAGDLAGAHAVAVSPDGAFVYVAASTNPAGPSPTDSITVFSRNTTTGVVTPVAGPAGCISEDPPVLGCATAVAGIRGVTRLVVTAESVYAVSPTRSTLVRLTRSATTGLAFAECFRGTGSPEGVCGSSETDGLKGASDLAIPTDGKNLYVASKDSNAVAIFGRNPTTGVLSAAGCEHGSGASDCSTAGTVNGLHAPQGIAATNGNVYLASGSGAAPGTGNTLVELDRGGTGALSASHCFRDSGSSAESSCADALGLVGGTAIAITADEKFLYVSAAGGNDVAEFSRDTTNGDLGPLAGSDQCVGQVAPPSCPTDNRGGKGITGASSIVAPGAGAANPNHVYVTSPVQDAIAEFRTERAPTCSSPTVTAQHDQRTRVDLTSYCQDPNGDPLTYSRFSNPTNGALSSNPNGHFKYTPRPRFGGGIDSFTFRANDGHVFSSVATLTLNVPPISADHDRPIVHLQGVPTEISKHDLTTTGITFREKAEERVNFRNALLSSPRELGRGSSSHYGIVLATNNFGFGFGPRDVVLKPSSSSVAGVSRFKVKIRILATDANGNQRTRTKTVQVHP